MLQDAGLIESEKSGRTITYRLVMSLLVLPLDAALPVSVALMLAALVFTIVQLLRLRKPRGTTLPA